MKHVTTMMLVGALAAAGCGGASSGNKPTDPNRSTASSDSAGSNFAGGTPASAPGCEQEIALECGEGAADGCLDGRTTVHVCVTVDAASGGSCSEEIALNCATGQFDACLRTPALATMHICVFEPPTQ